MRRGHFYNAIGLWVLLSVCACGDKQKSRPYDIKRLALLDVQGLWGGHNLFVDGNGNGWQETVVSGDGGLETTRHQCALTKRTMEKLEGLAAEHGFFEIKTKDRLGEPDEAHPIIYIETTDGKSAYVRKWDGDKHPDFDPIYTELLNWAESNETQAGSHLEPKPFDWQWRPDGFADIEP